MSGWMVATAAAAILGMTASTVEQGPALAGPTSRWSMSSQDGDSLSWIFDEQAAKIIKGFGSHIGVSIRDLEDADAKSAKGSTGVVIEQVEEDSPAQKAGLKAGDVVVEFDGERVRSTRQFTRLVSETPAGRQVAAAVLRDGQRVTVNVQPRDGGSVRYFESGKPFDFAVPKKVPSIVMPKFEGFFGPQGRLGIAVDELSPQLAEYFGTKDGVLVTSVTDNSNASRAGVKAGDVITSINGGAVTSATDLQRRAQRLEGGDEFTLDVVRNKSRMTLKGKVEQPQTRRSTVRTTI